MSKFYKVWSKFSTTAKKGSGVFNFRMMDMPENLREDVVNLYINCFIKQEVTFKAAGVTKSVKALNEVRESILKAVAEPGLHTVICCKDNDGEQIKDVVGASLMRLAFKGDLEPDFGIPYNKSQTQEIKKVFEISFGLAAYFDEVKVYNLDRYYSDRGVFVCSEFRGLGIAQEFFKVRRMMCKEHGIPINGGWMTSYGTQKAAERDGWETVCEIPYEELGRKHNVTFEDNPPSAKFMIARID